jgi:hypothetical protein
MCSNSKPTTSASGRHPDLDTAFAAAKRAIAERIQLGRIPFANLVEARRRRQASLSRIHRESA